MLRPMPTLAVLLLIAAAAVTGVQLGRTRTVADGRVLEPDLLELLRVRGVTTMSCDRDIPIGIDGATFTCVAPLDAGGTQTAEYQMDWRRQPPVQADPRDRRAPAADPAVGWSVGQLTVI